ncbi:transglutaminase domain-containing protein [Paenibacillus cisolokensis]|uniref:transglutaminase domain-containing protein n=1 Tax=Paenibacillus cisolokensis TaxID=1658519 RepID=UPI003D2827B5
MIADTSVFSLDQETMERVEQRFREKRRLARAKERELFGIFHEEELTEEETWALKYLYAYMPVNDLADYEGSLFLSHVRKTLEIRKEVPWGDKVPDHLFLYYVLPYRVNTENIEDSRGILYRELAERTKNLSMADAILETNYWCHEKATYTGSDLRTASPLATIRSARGRCGEEATLAVAALRSIGIPARQVYTPRWAHCDDNHAWVEAWADGEWYYFGACEPEPRLNQGWFSPPARRAMLVNTRIFANYPGPEDITLADKWFTEINLLDGYAPTRTVTVAVKDEQGRPAGGADVHFQLYNMAEFYPIASLKTNGQGEATFKTGFGDLLIRAVKEGRFGEAKLAAQEGRIELILDQTGYAEGTLDFDMVPPPERDGDGADAVPEEEMERHRKRVEEGAAIRRRYEETFIQEEEAAGIARELGLPQERVSDVLGKARGNGREIAAFLKERTPEYGEWPLRLLESLNEKDLVDTFRPALNDHLIGSLAVRGELPEDDFVRYVLCPRVQYEMIVPYRRLFQEAFTEAEIRAFKSDPSALAATIDEGWEVWEDLPNLKGKGNPVGTFRLKAGDRTSLDILFVAVCRSLGIPARLHPSEQKPQYRMNGGWTDVRSAESVVKKAERKEWGRLRLLRDAEAAPDAPAASYFGNFSFARLENGVFKTLLYPYGKSDVYDETFEVEPGTYRLTTGNRLKDGTVRVRFNYFTVRANELTEVALTFRHASLDIPVLGAVDRSRKWTLPDGTQQSIEEAAGDGAIFIAWIEPEREPSKHLLRELGELAEPFAEQSVPVVLIGHDCRWAAAFREGSHKLPTCAVIACDPDFAVLESVLPRFRAHEAGFPHVFVLDSQGRIRYAQSGYKLGTGKEALRIVTGLRP